MKPEEIKSRRKKKIEAIAQEFEISYFDAFTVYQIKMCEVYFDNKIQTIYNETAETKTYENTRKYLKRITKDGDVNGSQ